jgi:rhodanese-related sulfurtransferase
MALKRVSPEEAKRLVEQGWQYLDVRSVPEFAAGHPTGAYNIPILHLGPAGMQPNPDFVAQVKRAFPADAPLVVGCKAGGRSLQACAILEAAGFTSLVDQRAGFDGTGEPGWRALGYTVSQQAEPGRSFDELAK